MATVSVPAEGARGGLLRRPTATTGFWSWITTVDHKRIGILYGMKNRAGTHTSYAGSV